jgi:GDSL-like Lipase/Acylhydrolase family
VRAGRTLVIAGVAALAVVASAELFSRLVLGLGDPPLTLRDAKVDYLFAPGIYHRFGNVISYNSFSMRADELAPRKTDPDELRVLVIGDSVVNGGALTDDSKLATRIAQQRLAAALKRPVWVGNVSAGSWGPGNQVAYLRKFGTFDADITLVVLSTHDLADVPDFQPDLGPDFPTERPLLAVEEAVVRYVPRYIPWLRSAVAEPPHRDAARTLAEGRRELEALLRELEDQVPHVMVLHHRERSEPEHGPGGAATILRQDVKATGATYLELQPYLKRAHANESPYQDDIHVNDLGQQLYADAFVCATLLALGRRTEGCA